MIKNNSKEVAFQMFSEWYEYCLENGVIPEEVVSDFGEMILVTDPDLVQKMLETD